MKIFAFYVFVVAMLALAWADVTCTIDGKTLKVGQSHQPAGQCSLYKCTAEGLFNISNCPPLPTLTNKCKLIEKDVTKPFPDCCVRVVCK